MSTAHWTCPECGDRNIAETPRCLRCKGYQPASELQPRVVSWWERRLDALRRQWQDLRL